MGKNNPFRYRGYYYDEDTNLYCLGARYYSPEWRRFISPDDTAYLDPETPNGLNLYCYCGNDPVNYCDPSGHSIIAAWLIGLGAIGVIGGLGYAAYTDYQDDNNINCSIGWQKYFGYSVIGGAIGVGIGFGIGYWGPGISSYIGSIFSSIGAASGLAFVGGGTSSATMASILEAMLAAGALALFAKGFGPRMGHNQYEKKQWDEAMRRLGIKDKDLIRRLHNEKNKYPYQDTLKGLIEVLEKILAKWSK